MRPDRGFTLAECVVASTLCAVGLLAIAATSRATLELGLLGHRTAIAAQLAASRLAVLKAGDCAVAAPSGADTSGAYITAWSISSGPRGGAAVIVVRFTAAGRARTLRFEALLPCSP